MVTSSPKYYERRAIFAFAVLAGPGKSIHVEQARVIAPQDWQPSLKVSAQNLVLFCRVRFDVPYCLRNSAHGSLTSSHRLIMPQHEEKAKLQHKLCIDCVLKPKP